MNKNNGKIEPELLGIKKASTFTGFCSKHDDGLFSKIEKATFEATPEQCFLCGYRAISRELYTKEALANSSPLRRDADKGKPPAEQNLWQTFNFLFDAGLASGVGDSSRLKSEYDKILLDEKYHGSRAYVLKLTDPPPIMCAAGWFPTRDFDGNELQDLMKLSEPAIGMTCTSFSSDGNGYIVFQWLAENDAVCQQFITSLARMNNDDLTNALVRLWFQHFENIFMQPDWWEALNNETQASLVDRMARSANPFTEQLVHPLADDGVVVPAWDIVARKMVGFNIDDGQSY